MRRLMLIAPLVVAAVAVPSASAAKPNTLTVNWTESKEVPSAGGSMVFHVSRIVVRGASWSVTAKITNRTTSPIAVEKGSNFAYNGGAGLGVAWAVPATYSGALTVLLRTTVKPAMPITLAPGASWAGTFGGYGVLPRGKLIWITFGNFSPAGSTTADFHFDWVTNHSFKWRRRHKVWSIVKG